MKKVFRRETAVIGRITDQAAGGNAMNGLELAREYYRRFGEPMLRERFPFLFPFLAAGLAGDGSECLGFDDEISADHDYGPGFCIWMRPEDFEKHGKEVQRFYDSLPDEFAGMKARKSWDGAGERIGAMSVRDFYARFIGLEQPPASNERWLFLPEEKLAAAVSGEVFMDGPGMFSRIREALLSYYPEDVRIKKIAARAAFMAQTGQYNYGRSMRREDPAAAQIAITSFLKSTMSMWFLLGKTYAPYYKWMFRSLERMAQNEADAEKIPSGRYRQRLSRVLELLREICLLPEQSGAWPKPLPEGTDPYENRADRKVNCAEEICTLTLEELREQELTDAPGTFLEPHAREIMKRVRDPKLRGMHVLAG